MAKITTLILLAILSAPLHAGQFSALISASFVATHPNGPQPAPAPSGKCDNCGGTGKLGDGTVTVTCPVCDGTGKATTALPADQQPTPMPAVSAGLNELGPLARKRMVVYGSGFDARWEITAAKREPTLTVVGVEIDPQVAESARRYVAHAGLSDRVTILTGDAVTTDIHADIGAAYLWPDTLEALRPKIAKLDRFVSYAHAVPGLSMERRGDVYVYRRPMMASHVVSRPVAAWNGRTYTRAKPGCNCAMCQSIRAQLASQQSVVQQPSGHWEKRTVKVCRNGVCLYETQYVWVVN